ncbi:MAG: putative amino-acid racemase [Candidatus Anoxychlamydiales bacterium]|nr:putative amino-acid racemase [Candidatus Anoxychlamydiales bacterium]NGX36328.1 putative amino-acid racemase [Candidatus Anoxychlamydiales bacterium]
MKTKSIGIISGAGPMAGVLLTKKIIELCQKKYGCIDDKDFPKIILFSYPFSEMLKPNTKNQNEKKVKKELKDAIDFLIDSKSDYITIACNTLHAFLNSNKADDRLINLIFETKRFLFKKNLSKVLILSTKTSALKNIFDFDKTKLLSKQDQKWIDKLIEKILSGFFSLKDQKRLENFIFKQIKKDPSIDCVLLGCTELSVLMDDFLKKISNIKIIDPLEIISKKLCKLIFTTNQKGEKKCLQ